MLAKRLAGGARRRGHVLDPADVDRVRDAGGQLVVMPHGDAAVIARAVAAGLACTPASRRRPKPSRR